ncbi:hypothetical protein ABZ883_20160 [Streptomyces sp. NPDC046977]|uniref:hypothetical protein n=1 Tax=Streptomyces sp. NPDC046977 TaxID=3154703 RepID=UPI0033E9A302
MSRTKRRQALDEDAATAARLVEGWLAGLEPRAVAEPARRWRESGGRPEPRDVRRFAAWFRERTRLHLLGGAAGDGVSVRPGPPEDAERTRAETLSLTRDALALSRWLRAGGYE